MFNPTVLSTLFVLSFLAKRVIAAPAPAPRLDRSIAWGSCENFGATDPTDPNLWCGYLEVPVDYHDRSAGNAHLAVFKYSATAPEKIGTIFFNPGELSNSGVKAIARLGKPLSRGSHGLYDFVSWDPRGVGYTTAGTPYCHNTAGGVEFGNNALDPNIDDETASEKPDQQGFDVLCSQGVLAKRGFSTFTTGTQCGPSGSHSEYLGTSCAVRDLVSLGDAIVGQDQPIHYWGISHGTVTGVAFVKLFPERAGYVILDGVMGPNIWMPYEFLQPSPLDTKEIFSCLTDGWGKEGMPGCRLVEITGDGVTGDDVEKLTKYAPNVIEFPPLVISDPMLPLERRIQCPVAGSEPSPAPDRTVAARAVIYDYPGKPRLARRDPRVEN